MYQISRISCAKFAALQSSHCNTNLIPRKESFLDWIYKHFGILLREKRLFWLPHMGNPTNCDANFVSNSHDHFHCIQKSDTSKLFHVSLILLSMRHLQLILVRMRVIFWMIGEFYEWNETKTKIKKIILIFGSSWFFFGCNIEWYCIQRLKIWKCNKDTHFKSM